MIDAPATAGLVGLGRMGLRIAEAAPAAGMKLVAALDPNPAPWATAQMPDLKEIHTVETDEFFSTPMQALIVSTPATSHMEYLERGLDAGIHRFLIEKPVASRLADADSGLRKASAAGARVVVDHIRRYSDRHRRLRGIAESGELGELRGISITTGAGGGATLGTHYFDLCNFLFGGLPETVTASLTGDRDSNPRGPQFDDPGVAALMVYAGGARAMVEIAGDTGIPPLLELRYTYGRIVVEDEAGPWRVLQRSPEDRHLPLTRYGAPTVENSLDSREPFTLTDLLPNVLADVLADEPPICGLEEGIAALEVFVAIRQSAERGETVALPLSSAVRRLKFEVA